MGRFFGKQKFTDLEKLSATTLRMLSGAHVQGSGQGISTDSILSLDFGITGIGGLDTGAIAASTLYYIYLVNVAGTKALVASTSSLKPSGFSVFAEVGKVFTNDSSEIVDPVKYGDDFLHTLTLFQSTNALTNGNAELEFNLGTATKIEDGAGLVSISDDAANTRTKFNIICKKAKVSINGMCPNNVNAMINIMKNGSTIIGGSSWGSGSGNQSTCNISNDRAVNNDFYSAHIGGTGRSPASPDPGAATVISLAAGVEFHVNAVAKYEDVI